MEVQTPSRLVNPFLAIRQRTGLSQAKFALTLGIGTVTVAQAELGQSAHPRSIILALAKHGYDPDQLQEQYSAWRESRLASLRENTLNLAALAGPAGGGE